MAKILLVQNILVNAERKLKLLSFFLRLKNFNYNFYNCVIKLSQENYNKHNNNKNRNFMQSSKNYWLFLTFIIF